MEKVLSYKVSWELYMDMRRVVELQLMSFMQIPDPLFDGYEARVVLVDAMKV